jgi:uncharacterized Fe-S cluster-containing radical SAM superfamily protein
MSNDTKTESDQDDVPHVPVRHLDQLWFQVAGTRCNLACHHCFISCHPQNLTFGFLSRAEVRQRLQESVPLGVKEYYFTGGEPFLNPDMTDILVDTLDYGPATVLTNGTVLQESWLQRLREAADASTYGLEFRVSIDGFTPQQNDAVRGPGTFQRAMHGVRRLVESGFLPIITAVRTWDPADDLTVIHGFRKTLHDAGYRRPRLKIMPTLQIGAEASRTGGYHVGERVTCEMMDDYDVSLLVCHNSRIVTDRGVHVCPILIEAADSWLGQSLAESLVPYSLRHGACLTCYQYGAICSNVTGQSANARQLPVLPGLAVNQKSTG